MHKLIIFLQILKICFAKKKSIKTLADVSLTHIILFIFKVFFYSDYSLSSSSLWCYRGISPEPRFPYV